MKTLKTVFESVFNGKKPTLKVNKNLKLKPLLSLNLERRLKGLRFEPGTIAGLLGLRLRQWRIGRVISAAVLVRPQAFKGDIRHWVKNVSVDCRGLRRHLGRMIIRVEGS